MKDVALFILWLKLLDAGVADVQTVVENGVARYICIAKRGYLDNGRERIIAAGITGATLKGGLEIIR